MSPYRIILIRLFGKFRFLSQFIYFSSNRLPELDSAFLGRLELMCSENQLADEWIPVFIALLEATRGHRSCKYNSKEVL